MPQRPLPMARARPDRRDAARNRELLVAAARSLVRAGGPQALTMQAVAQAAGVGKGTVFRRFGDRAGLIRALLDEDMRVLQDGFLHGPPPLGPGAAPQARLEAFAVQLVAVADAHLDLALAFGAGQPLPPGDVYGSLLVHVRTLIEALDEALDADAVASMLLGAWSPPVIHGLRRERGLSLAAVQNAAAALVRGVGAGG